MDFSRRGAQHIRGKPASCVPAGLPMDLKQPIPKWLADVVRADYNERLRHNCMMMTRPIVSSLMVRKCDRMRRVKGVSVWIGRGCARRESSV